MSYRILCLLDHSRHHAEESIYPFLALMSTYPGCEHIFMASRGNPANTAFFERGEQEMIAGFAVDQQLVWQADGQQFLQNQQWIRPEDFDLVMMRLPKPNPAIFFGNISERVGAERIINRATQILKTGSKAYLLNFPDLCPPMRLCYSVEEVLDFARQFPIVLKPFLLAGGKGLLRIEGERLWEGEQMHLLDDFLPELTQRVQDGYLAMEYLVNVHEGDKRIVVVNGEIIASALRLPPPGSWLCNVSMGGRSVPAEADEDEVAIAQQLAPALLQEGIVWFGFDTLMGNQGRRVLSEINTSCPGGLYSAELQSGQSYVIPAVERYWQYIETHIPDHKQI